MENKKINKKVIIIAVAVLVAVFITLGGLYFAFAPKTVGAGAKQITIEIIHSNKTTKEYIIKTDAEFLREPLEKQKIVSGNESSYGLFITTADGETVDQNKQQWWCITKGGQAVNNGVDSQPIINGEKYEITFTTGY